MHVSVLLSYLPHYAFKLTPLSTFPSQNRPLHVKFSFLTAVTINIVTYRPSARQRLSKDIPAEADARSNTTSITRQRISKPALSTIKRLCFLCDPCLWVIKRQRRSLFSRIGSSSGDGSWRRLRKMAINELGWAKRTSCMIRSYSETVINLLPGNDLWRLIILVRMWQWTVKCVNQRQHCNCL
jgi:hypothetical protein